MEVEITPAYIPCKEAEKIISEILSDLGFTDNTQNYMRFGSYLYIEFPKEVEAIYLRWGHEDAQRFASRTIDRYR